MYEYSALVVAVVDGDTVDLRVDLGFRFSHTDRFRLRGIDSPEMNSADPLARATAKAAKTRLQALVGGKSIFIRTRKDEREKYGRYLVDLILEDGQTASAVLIAEGLGRPYEGGAR